MPAVRATSMSAAGGCTDARRVAGSALVSLSCGRFVQCARAGPRLIGHDRADDHFSIFGVPGVSEFLGYRIGRRCPSRVAERGLRKVLERNPTLTHIGPTRVEIAGIWRNPGPNLADMGPTRAGFGRTRAK